MAHDEIERALRMEQDVLELRKGVLVALDVIAVLDLVEPVRRPMRIPPTRSAKPASTARAYARA